ncbi:hypothetical protein MJT46_009385 [Ovis ammon polii x Ovis aries]|nr:hypothetical protein MJT46_009385 [Ovis ammon polii x Ovis aries]
MGELRHRMFSLIDSQEEGNIKIPKSFGSDTLRFLKLDCKGKGDQNVSSNEMCGSEESLASHSPSETQGSRGSLPQMLQSILAGPGPEMQDGSEEQSGGRRDAAHGAVVEGCCYQVLPCVIQAFRWKRSGFLLKKPVIPMDVN